MQVANVSKYKEFADTMQNDIKAFDSWVNGLSDESKKRELRKKILAMQNLLSAISCLLKSGNGDSEYFLAKYKVDLLKMKKEFEENFRLSNSNSYER